MADDNPHINPSITRKEFWRETRQTADRRAAKAERREKTLARVAAWASIVGLVPAIMSYAQLIPWFMDIL